MITTYHLPPSVFLKHITLSVENIFDSGPLKLPPQVIFGTESYIKLFLDLGLLEWGIFYQHPQVISETRLLSVVLINPLTISCIKLT